MPNYEESKDTSIFKSIKSFRPQNVYKIDMDELESRAAKSPSFYIEKLS